MSIYNFQCNLFKKQYCLQDLRVVFRDPEKPYKTQAVEKIENGVNKPEGEVLAEEYRGREDETLAGKSPEELEQDRHYALGKGEQEFDLDNESGKAIRNISERAAVFIRQWPEARETLKQLYEYDAYSYIHTVQMLNEACTIVDDTRGFEEIKKTIVSAGGYDSSNKFSFANDDELKTVFIGSVVFHDLGKTRVDRKLLNAGNLTFEQFKEVSQHAIRTVEILIPMIAHRVKKLFPDIKMEDLIDENGVLRGNNAKIKNLTEALDRFEDKIKGDESDINTYEAFFSDASNLIEDIAKITEYKAYTTLIQSSIVEMEKAILNGKYESVQECLYDIRGVLKMIKNRNAVETDRIQSEIKEPIEFIRKNKDCLDEKRLLQMLYLAASHHLNKPGRGYPLHEELTSLLYDFENWLNSSGNEQSIVLTILDVNDAMRSKRSYKSAIDKPDVDNELRKDFVGRDDWGSKYEKIVELFSSKWKKMSESDNYSEYRTNIYGEEPKTRN